MNKANVEELTRKLNEFRMNSLNKTFNGKELNQALMGLGFTTTIASGLASKCFPFEQIGKSRLYAVPSIPIHKSVVASVYERNNSYHKKNHVKSVAPKKSLSTDEAWQTLIDAGIIKTKFNLSILKTKYPAIYLECLEYEIVK